MSHRYLSLAAGVVAAATVYGGGLIGTETANASQVAQVGNAAVVATGLVCPPGSYRFRSTATDLTSTQIHDICNARARALAHTVLSPAREAARN
jgi:hypothetical protein